jgi:SAM-dependent methyltransferase
VPVDFGRTALDYATHRAGFPDALFDRLRAFGIGIAGQRLLDLGSGTGTLARGFARRGAVVTAIDVSSEMLAQAADLDAEAGVHVAKVVAPAEATGLPPGAFDVVTAGQCWHWFDRAAAAAEARRLLVAGGALAIAHFDWVSLAPGDLVDAMEKLIARHNPAQPAPHFRFGGGVGVYGPWLADVAAAGFRDIETFSFDVAAPYSQEAWRGRVRASQGVGAMLAPDAVAVFDREHAALIEAIAGAGSPLAVPHRVFAVIARAPR